MIGSDAILEPGNNNHPRCSGCFTRTLGRYVRELGVLTLVDALAKMTIQPARRLEARVPALQTKGRLQIGADADITIFDPATVGDRSTIADPAQMAGGHPVRAGERSGGEGRRHDEQGRATGPAHPRRHRVRRFPRRVDNDPLITAQAAPRGDNHG